jgi:hypothetical protein
MKFEIQGSSLGGSDIGKNTNETENIRNRIYKTFCNLQMGKIKLEGLSLTGLSSFVLCLCD